MFNDPDQQAIAAAREDAQQDAREQRADEVCSDGEPDWLLDLVHGLCDRGELCYVCRHLGPMTRTTALGLPLFRCTHCGAEQFDNVTTPTADAWLPNTTEAVTP